MLTQEPAIVMEQLQKSYGTVQAVSGVMPTGGATSAVGGSGTMLRCCRRPKRIE